MSNSLAKDCTVAVLMGGTGEERDVSLESGRCVLEAIKDSVNAIPVDITPYDLSILDCKDIDVFFLALHGKFGEDGQLQKILQDKNLKYTGSDPASSYKAFDKAISKEIFQKNGLLTPSWLEITEYPDHKDLTQAIKAIGDKYVIKPSKQGSSMGIEILDDPAESAKAAAVCLARFGSCIIEQFIEGKELTVSIVGSQILPIIEIVSASSFYDYNAKYCAETTQYLFDTITDSQLVEDINQRSVECFNVLNCRHFARIDFILDSKNDYYLLEANTLPGMTSHSLLPKAAKRAGLSLTDLYLKIINQALMD